jgi:hypothetical protein
MDSNINIPDILNKVPSTSDKVSLEKFAQYFDKILEKTKKKNTCVLNSHFISDYYITIDFTTFKYIIPDHIINKLKECNVDSNIKYYIIPLILKLNDSDSHANVLIINNITKTIELFEPHGSNFLSNDPSLNFDYLYHIRNLIKYILHSKNDFKFKNVHPTCPYTGFTGLGLQTKQVQYSRSGLCVAWILFFIHTRLLNLDKAPEDIIIFFNNFDSEKLDLYIRKYTALIESETVEIKKYHKDYTIDFILHEDEIKKIIINIKKNVNDYLSHVNQNINQVKVYDDIKQIFKKFIIYSKFDFFDNLYFKTIERYFRR